MVTLNGAIAAQPYIQIIQQLQAAFNALGVAVTGGGSIWKIDIQVYTDATNKASSTITIPFTFNAQDSAAILNDIKNIIGNDINIEINSLGAIT